MLGYRPGGELPWQTPDRTHAIKKASNLIHFFENLFICQFMYFALTSVPYCWILGHLIYSFPCKRDTNATNMWACFLCGSDRIASDGYKEMSTVSKFIAMNSLIHLITYHYSWKIPNSKSTAEMQNIKNCIIALKYHKIMTYIARNTQTIRGPQRSPTKQSRPRQCYRTSLIIKHSRNKTSLRKMWVISMLKK